MKNPLRGLRDGLARRSAEVEGVRSRRDALAELRERRAGTVAERDRWPSGAPAPNASCGRYRRRNCARASSSCACIAKTLAAAQAERASYDDVADFPAERIAELDAAFYAWRAAEGAAAAAERDAEAAQLSIVERSELAARRADAGTIDDLEFQALRDAAEQATTARAAAAAAANEAAAARRDGSGGRTLAGVALAIASTFAVLAIAMAIAHWWSFTEVFAAVAAVAFAVVVWRSRERIRNARAAAHKQRIADESLSAERKASATVAAVLERLGVTSIEDLAHRRERLAELLRMQAGAERATARANDVARGRARRPPPCSTIWPNTLVPDASGTRPERCAIADERAQRRRKRDGVDSGMAMLALQRSEILRDDDEFALVAERDALTAAGIAPADDVRPRVARRSRTPRSSNLDRLIRDAELATATLTVELKLGESAIPDLAPLEEDVERLRAEIEHLEALDRALRLAADDGLAAHARSASSVCAPARNLRRRGAAQGHRRTLQRDPRRSGDVHRAARVPETGAIDDLDVLSAGTRDQVYLIIRIAMARMFAEGLELPPLLLDDPFAYWDDTRIERCIPIIAHNAFDAQTILFTASPDARRRRRTHRRRAHRPDRGRSRLS